MTAIDTEDLAVITGPLIVNGREGFVYLEPGEVVRIEEPQREGESFAYVYGMSSDFSQYIDVSSLTPLSEIQDDPDIEWGDAADAA